MRLYNLGARFLHTAMESGIAYASDHAMGSKVALRKLGVRISEQLAANRETHAALCQSRQPEDC